MQSAARRLFFLKRDSIQGERKNLQTKRLVIAEGEHTGHNHVIEDESTIMFQVGDKFYLELEKAATVKHQEHKPVTLSPGIWEIGRVQEYDWFSKMTRQVVD
jgi:hypothetical protein